VQSYQDCYWSYEDQRFTVGNAKIERSWTWKQGGWYGHSIVDKGHGGSWITPQQDTPMFRLPLAAEDGKVSCYAKIDNDYGIGAEHLMVHAEVTGALATVRLVVRIYPGEAVLRQEVQLRSIPSEGPTGSGTVLSASRGSEGIGVQLDDNNTEDYALPGQYVDHLLLSDTHVKWTCISLVDRTDSNNNLVQSTEGLCYPNEKRSMKGSLMLFRKTLASHGLLLLKEGPTEYGHLHYEEEDFRFVGRQLFLTGGGFAPDFQGETDYLSAYGSVIGVYDGSEEGALTLLHRYHQQIHRYQGERDFFLMSNTWGDRNKDGRIQESFILKEIEAASELGISIVQIDDGWQQGTTKNSVQPGGRWSGYYKDGTDFWSVNRERFPHGLDAVSKSAVDKGIELGLWFSPDSSHDFAHWEQDAQKLVKLYGSHGIRYFKLDGIHIASKRGERNLLRLLQQVLKDTAGAVCFNLDTTAQVRLGYFGRTQYGAIFLENRYTDWSNYYPHWTLRNLWQLAPYVPAQKLQMEFLNVERNQESGGYLDDPLAPGECGILYAFAVTMFSNPLAWMELSELSAASKQLLKQIIPAYMNHQSAILDGMILPIGKEPDGASWTGFQSIRSDREGYVLVLRERAAEASASLRLWKLGDAQLRLFSILRSDGPGQVEAVQAAAAEQAEEVALVQGKLQVTLEKPFSFVLYRYEAIGRD
jgi:alpha-galactosidase